MIIHDQMESYGYGGEAIFIKLEQRIMLDIVRRIYGAGVITRSADFQINQLYNIGYSSEDIKKMLKETMKYSDEYVDYLYDMAIKTDYIGNKELYKQINGNFIPYEKNTFLQGIVKAAKQKTHEKMQNLTQSLGFVLNEKNGLVEVSLTEYFKKVLDRIVVDIQTGAFDYNTTLRKAVQEMTNSGVRWIDYESKYHNRITVVARRAVMSSISDMCNMTARDTAAKLGVDTFEVTAHPNARPMHAMWQGGIYTSAELESTCGLGTVTGLQGANCYHLYYPFVPGISKRAYTEHQLREWRSQDEKTYRGKTYTGYEATQRMRQMETNIRAMREKITLLKEGKGDPLDIMYAQARYRTAMDEYVKFAKAMGLKQQKERIYMDGLGRISNSISNKQLEKNILLYKGYKKAINKGDISSFITFEIYQDIAKQIEKELVGVTTKDGIMITGYKTHFVDRIIGQYESSNAPIKGKRKGVSIGDVLKTLENPNKVSEKNTTSGKSRNYYSNSCIITVNPNTGNLIQTTPKK